MKRIKALAKTAYATVSHRAKDENSDVGLAGALFQLLRYRLTWNKHDLDYLPDQDLPAKFISARSSAALIPDGAVVLSTGIAGNSRCSIFFWAVRDRFEKTGRPAGLTWMVVAGVGGRGKAPGTIEELGLPGLVICHITGHLESHKSLLALGHERAMVIHTMPQGVMCRIIEAQGKGIKGVRSMVGLGTFFDPATGGGTCVTSQPGQSLVRPDGEALFYNLPNVDTALFCAPYADRFGNIYFKNAATITENRTAAAAARANNGRVLVTVSAIVDHNPADISIPADQVDAIVVNPRNEQTGGVLQRKYFTMFTEGAKTNIVAAYNLLQFANIFSGITPVRDSMDNVVAKMAAALFVRETRPGALINIGVGLPEEVSRILFENGLYKELTFTTESGVYGGLPVSGMYFGAAINPEKLIGSAEMFRLYETKLDIAVLGFLEVDSDGNVNVSRRGPDVRNYVGPGGFPDIVSSAGTIIFVGKWGNGGRYRIKNGRLVIEKPGSPKFIRRVEEITFNGKRAAAQGKRVYYVSTVGVFRLTEAGVELVSVMPGVDIQKDIIGFCGAKINIPQAGPVPVVDDALISGHGFALHF